MEKTSQANLSRRGFIGGAAALGAASLAVAAPALADETSETLSADDVTWDKEYDFVVVGTGTAVFAAFAALDAGAQSVGLIDKSPAFGGTACYSGGAFWIPCNSHMLAEGYEDNREDAITYVLAGAEGQTTQSLVETYVDAAPAFADWVTSYMGFEWDFISGEPLYGPQSWMDYCDYPGCRPYGRTLTIAGSNVGETAESESYGGPLMWSLIHNQIDENDAIDMMLGTAVTDLITDDSGTVVGVKCEDDSGTLYIKSANGVLLGTGGFDHDAQWRKWFLRMPMFNTVSVPTDTGDGQKMGLKLNAAIGNMQNVWGTPATIPPADLPTGDAVFDGSVLYNDMLTIFDSPIRRAKPNAIVVNRFGERFGDESASYHHFNRTFEGWDAGEGGPRNIPAFFIGDATFFANYLLPGTANDAQVGDIPEGTVVADSMEELANELGIDYDGLVKTLEQFNADAKEGIDSRFHRGEHMFDLSTGADFSGRTDIVNPCLGPVETPPFYGYAYLPGALGTSGGLVIDETAHVLTVDGEEIPHLYACGNCTASIMGAGYPGGGSTVAAGSVMGWIAAYDAMGASRPE